MKRNLFAFTIIIVLTLGLAYKSGTNSGSENNNTESNYMNIFTPYHNVKGVFVQYNEDTENNDASSYVKVYNSNMQRQITTDEIELIASIVHAESKGEPYEGKVAVASVIINRLYHPNFPKSIKDIVYQKNAFSCIHNGKISVKPDMEAYKAVNDALNGNDPTDDAVFFYNPKTASCKWMKSVQKYKTITIGNHVFFK